MQYRRSRTAAGTFFFTVNTAIRDSPTLTDHIDALRESVAKVRNTHPMGIVAMVVLPDHLHAIWTLPSGDYDFALRWMLIKAAFSRQLPKAEFISDSRARKRERGIWQRRYWEHEIQDEIDLARHIDYIHFNPVKHGYVAAPADWPYSSIHRYIRRGVIPIDWAVDVDCNVSEAE